MTAPSANGIQRLRTGIPGLDAILQGGLPAGRATLVVGTAGSGKTVLGAQLLAAGVRGFDEAGVLVTFDEAPADVLRHCASFEWDLTSLVADDRVAVVDCSSDPDEDVLAAGDFQLVPLLARIRQAAERVGAGRVVLDSVTALLPQLDGGGRVRYELGRVVHGLNRLGVTTVLTAERLDEYGLVGRHGVEEFVTDAVVILRNSLSEQRRRRTIEILKFRGAAHQSGEFPCTIEAQRGLSVVPYSAIEIEREAARERVSLGNPGVDELFGGGVYRDSLVLVSGPTGTGKTLLALTFVKAAVDAGERALLLAFEESHGQLVRNSSSWLDLAAAERAGGVRVRAAYPERMGLEDLLQQIQREIAEHRPNRIVIDSLTALERVSADRPFREFLVRLIGLLKEAEIAALFTTTSSMLSGGETVTDAYVSTITDGIVLLRYAEIDGEIRRAATVLKMRGSAHDRRVREYRITADGMEIGEPIEGMGGLVVPRRDRDSGSGSG